MVFLASMVKVAWRSSMVKEIPYHNIKLKMLKLLPLYRKMEIFWYLKLKNSNSDNSVLWKIFNDAINILKLVF